MLAGERDTLNVARLYKELTDLTREGVRHIAIDLAAPEFVDSTGLSALIAAHKRAGALGGELVIVALNRDSRTLFEIPGSTRISTSGRRRESQPYRPVDDRTQQSGTAAASPGSPAILVPCRPARTRPDPHPGR
jgi:anti-sigma B factor antagonist